MAEYTRTYKYTDSAGWRHDDLEIPLSSFAYYSGDSTHAIKKITAISASTFVFRAVGESTGETGYRLGLKIGSESTYTRLTDWVTQRVSDAKWTGSLAAAFPQSVFPIRDFTSPVFKIYLYSGACRFDFAKHPLYLTITFTDEEYIPRIDYCDGYRCNSDGSQNNEGTSVYYSVKASAAMHIPDKAERSYLTLTAIDPVSGSDVLLHKFFDSRDSGTTVADINSFLDSAANHTGVIQGYTFSLGNKYNIRLNFQLYGEQVESALIYVDYAFVDIHHSPCSTGGVAFGKFSASTEGHPLFECNYPAYFSGGIITGFADKFHAVNVSKNVSGSTTLQYMGLSVTIPAHSYYSLTAYAGYNSRKPSHVLLNQSSTNANTGIVADASAGNTYCVAPVSGYTDTELTLYLWANWSNSDSNTNVWITGFYITL